MSKLRVVLKKSDGHEQRTDLKKFAPLRFKVPAGSQIHLELNGQKVDGSQQWAGKTVRLVRMGKMLSVEAEAEVVVELENYYLLPKVGLYGAHWDVSNAQALQFTQGGTQLTPEVLAEAQAADSATAVGLLVPVFATGSETALVAAVGVSVVALGSTTAGPVVAKEKSYQAVLPLGPSADINEATSTRTNKDDASDLMAVSVSVWAETAVKLNITSATTQARNRLGMMISADSSLQSVGRATDVTQVSRVNALVATALGLGGVDMVRGAPEATIKAEASVNFDSSNAYGNVLAAIAGTVEIDASISKLASGFWSEDALNATSNAALVQGALVAVDEMGTQTGLSAAVQSLINADISKVLMPSKSTIQVKEYISLRRSMVRRWHWMKSKVGPNTSWPVNGMTVSSPPKQEHRQVQVLGHDSRKADSSDKNHHGSEVFINS